MGLLEGVKVIDFTTYIAGSSCSRILADWKADVIKIEPLRGELFRIWGRTLGAPIEPDENPMFEVGNANKKGIALNVKSEEGLHILHELISNADVFVSNYRIQALENLHLTYEELHGKYPGLVYAFLNGYGADGGLSRHPGFDVISFWARGGILGYLGEPNASPVSSLPAGGDMITGSYLAGGILAALYGRRRTGLGEKVETSLYNGAIWSAGLHCALGNDLEDLKKSRAKPDSPLENSYCSADGVWFVLSVADFEAWPVLCRAIGLEELSGDERFATYEAILHNSEVLTSVLDRVFGGMDAEAIHERLRGAGIEYAPVFSAHEVNADGQAFDNDYLRYVTMPNGNTVPLPTPPCNFAREGRLAWERAPHVGRDTESVLRGLGYGGDEIQNLCERGVISCGTDGPA